LLLPTQHAVPSRRFTDVCPSTFTPNSKAGRLNRRPRQMGLFAANAGIPVEKVRTVDMEGPPGAMPGSPP